MNPFTSLLISPAELHHHLSKALPTLSRIIPIAAGNGAALASFEARHVPNSIFFNLDAVKDTTSHYPMMLPSATQFATYMTERGIRKDDILVIYDTFETGLRLSPRLAWTCRHFGHRDVHILDNFPRYVSEGFPVASGALATSAAGGSEVQAAGYPEPREINAGNVVSFEELRQMIKAQRDGNGAQEFQILDARPKDLFTGNTGAGADASVRLGHMPSAINVPFASVLGSDKTFLSAEELRDVFTRAGVREGVPAVLTCNTGVTATALDSALRVAGLRVDTKLYDGSWSEWADRAEEDMVVS
ncbi:sulfurtransferase [Aspergillus homomorphus CBS 101889]|uniref:Rhodanese-like protein n=1 Tax=Aspergillus homomorphus (strain CBS 101889) TaxID=1450537 RepID=A0A395I0L0_ASPHC|nr:Rhodanese-like protein [Aspergillus homomorphus CBS 101889]RAL13163.1 Rhodanese-like protein [Aspergillus homomorphus CBS 101889]